MLRSRAADDPTFRTLFERMRATALEAVADGGVPFESLVEALGVPRLIGRDPLVQVLFALQTPPPPPVFGAVRVAEIELDARAAKVDLTLSLECDEDGLRGLVEYDTDLFEPAEAARVAEQLRVLLRAGLAAPETPLSRLPLATPGRAGPAGGAAPPGAARARSGRWWSGSSPWAPSGPTRSRWRRSRRRAELRRPASRRARRWRAACGPRSRPAGARRSCSSAGPTLIVALVAALRAGVPYVALDPAYPAERLRVLAADAGCAAALTSAALAGRLPAGFRAAARRRRGRAAARRGRCRSPAPSRLRRTPSTPRARPASPRGCWSPTASSPPCTARWTPATASRRPARPASR